MKKRALCGLLAFAAAAMLFSGCGKQVGGDTFGFTLAAEPQQIDPQVADDTASLSVIAAVFEGLTRLDDNGKVVPGAADWTVSADGLVYTFKLKESWWSTVKVKGTETGFEDPVLVTAQDFVFGIRRTADPATASPYRETLAGIENATAVLAGKAPTKNLAVKALKDDTLEIRLTAPDAAFPEKLAGPGFMPCNSEFFSYTAGRYGLETRYILSNGAFSVGSWQHGQAVSLVKNTDYHAAAEILPAAVKYRITTDPTEDYELLEKGYIDGTTVPADMLDSARKAGIRLVELKDTVRFLWMNNAAAPLGNRDIRCALRDAIEWDALRGSMGAAYTPADGYVAPAATADGTVFRTEATATALHANAAAARTALNAGLAALGLKAMPALTILAADDTDSANLARYIVQSFTKNLSVRCTLELVKEETLTARVKAGSYQLAIFNATGRGLTAKENLQMFTTGGMGNYAHYAAPAYDALYAAADGSAASVKKLEAQLYADCPALPLGFYTRYYGLSPLDTGITVRPFGGGSFGALLSFRTADRTDNS